MAAKKTQWLNRPVDRRTFLKGSATGMASLLAADSLSLLRPVTANAQTRPIWPSPGYQHRYTLCEMCVWRCGVDGRVKNGKIVKLEGNPFHPHSNGKLCPRGQAGVDAVYDPDRLKYPLLRDGDRGSGKWRRISWDEALDYAASRMLEIKYRYGPETMVFSTTHNLLQPEFETLLKAFGSPNYGTQRSLCFNSMVAAHLFTYGFQEPERKYEGVQYMILAGRNLMEAISNSETQALMAAVAGGAKLVVVDPRFTRTAAKAAEWCPIRPGTDLAFFLAILQVMVSEGRYNKEFVKQYTVGFDEVAAAVQPYTPEWAAPICEIDAKVIRRLARELTGAMPNAFVHPNWRTSNFVNSFQAERTIAIINALLGNGLPGSMCSAPVTTVKLGTINRPSFPRVKALRLDGVPWKYPLVPLKLGVFQEMRDNIVKGDPYKARGWFIYRQNPVDSIANRKKTLEAFSKLDFIMTIDISMNDTAWFSDLVLPEATYLERYDPLLTIGRELFIRQPLIQPLFESKSGLWIFKELGKRLGLGDYFPYEDEEDYLRQQLKPLPISLEDLKARGVFRVPEEKEAKAYSFNTPSGKIELSSSILKRSGFTPVPRWEKPPRPAEGSFYLLTGKVAYHTQFATQNNKLLRERYPENSLWINPGAARKRGIKDGDKVLVESKIGRLYVKAKVTKGIRPDCVYMNQGFGHLSQGWRAGYGKGASDSDLHESVTDPVSGGQALTQTFVNVRKFIDEVSS